MTYDIWLNQEQITLPRVDLRVSGAEQFLHLLRFMLSWTHPRFQEPESDPGTGAQGGAGGLSASPSSPAM